MGLLDFLKKKPEAPAAAPTTPSASPAAPTASPAAEAPKPAGGPRYQRPTFATQAAPDLQPMMPMVPPMPPDAPQVPHFEPATPLEEALLRAAQEPDMRLAFYHELLHGELLVLTVQPEGTPSGEVTVDEGTEIQLHVLHDGRIPVFSCEQRIYDGGANPEEVNFLRIQGQALFQMVAGAECVLNPFSPFGKLLVAQELDDLLSGRIFGQGAEGQEQPQVQLSQITELPEGMAESLQQFCAAHPHIKAGHMAVMQLAGQPAAPRLLLAFEVDGEDMNFLQELGPVLKQYISEQETVDVVRLSADPEEPLTQYFSQQEPLYHRQEA
ncbi:enhanced serine sensitivity protein SseB C-terminal domain-containing protein [Hymenobacter sp. B81]|uniref:enhanced serine sensitivity protein SseB C-terminal domain-containing protein n=1 Tax=Hymenobacter sp. B81 TaxID=3344878 RepID=UPI0037DC9C1D